MKTAWSLKPKSELESKVKGLELLCLKKSALLQSGFVSSAFKGSGLQFNDHRIYQEGDDGRFIDWKASARSRDVLLKRYEEEREKAVFVGIDVSESMKFGKDQSYFQDAIEIAGAVGILAIKNNDKFGYAFCGEKIKSRPPSRSSISMFFKEALSQSLEGGVNRTEFVKNVKLVCPNRSLILFLSDRTENFEKKDLAYLKKAHQFFEFTFKNEPVLDFSYRKEFLEGFDFKKLNEESKIELQNDQVVFGVDKFKDLKDWLWRFR